MTPSFAALLAAVFSRPSAVTALSGSPFTVPICPEIFRANPVFSAVAIFRDSPTTKLMRELRFHKKAISQTET